MSITPAPQTWLLNLNCGGRRAFFSRLFFAGRAGTSKELRNCFGRCAATEEGNFGSLGNSVRLRRGEREAVECQAVNSIL